MTSFLVIRIEADDIPDDIKRAAFEATGGVLRAWSALNPDPEIRLDVDLLEPDGEGLDRRRHSVLSRLYAREPVA